MSCSGPRPPHDENEANHRKSPRAAALRPAGRQHVTLVVPVFSVAFLGGYVGAGAAGSRSSGSFERRTRSVASANTATPTTPRPASVSSIFRMP